MNREANFKSLGTIDITCPQLSTNYEISFNVLVNCHIITEKKSANYGEHGLLERKYLCLQCCYNHLTIVSFAFSRFSEIF